MVPLKIELPTSHDNPPGRVGPAEFSGIEVIASTHCLSEHDGQIRIDRSYRARMGAEACELGVVAISAGAATQHRLGEQRFAPERHESTRIEMTRVKGPESHVDGSPEPAFSATNS
jgi:hypothetical protein